MKKYVALGVLSATAFTSFAFAAQVSSSAPAVKHPKAVSKQAQAPKSSLVVFKSKAKHYGRKFQSKMRQQKMFMGVSYGQSLLNYSFETQNPTYTKNRTAITPAVLGLQVGSYVNPNLRMAVGYYYQSYTLNHVADDLVAAGQVPSSSDQGDHTFSSDQGDHTLKDQMLLGSLDYFPKTVQMGKVHPYVGALAGFEYTEFSAKKAPGNAPVDKERAPVFGGQAGVDVKVANHLNFDINLQYLKHKLNQVRDISATQDESQNYAVNLKDAARVNFAVHYLF